MQVAKKAQKVIVITGCSSGLGLAVAVLLAKDSHVVYATLRNLDKRGDIDSAAEAAGLRSGQEGGGRINVAQLDVTSDESVSAAISKCTINNNTHPPVTSPPPPLFRFLCLSVCALA